MEKISNTDFKVYVIENWNNFKDTDFKNLK